MILLKELGRCDKVNTGGNDMKVYEYSFRDLRNQVLEIQGSEVVNLIRSMNLTFDHMTGGCFYCYIDHEKGLMLELLAIEFENNEVRLAPKEYSYKMMIRPLMDQEVTIRDDFHLDLFKEKIESIQKEHAVSNELEQLRYLKELDASRHSEFPDDVRVYLLKKDVEPEAIWVRLTGSSDRKLKGNVLTKPLKDIDLEIGEIIEFGTTNMEDGSISCVCIME